MAVEVFLIYELMNIIAGLVLVEGKGNICGNTHLVQEKGSINSPNYPLPYPNTTNCTWTILSPPSSVLTLVVKDVDINDDNGCMSPPCCHNNGLILPQHGIMLNKKICGHNLTVKPIKMSRIETKIIFSASSNSLNSRGFSLFYNIKSYNSDSLCNPDEFQCSSGHCLSYELQCDGIIQCDDGSDETSCKDLCKPDQVICNFKSNHCFTPSLEHCDGIIQCPNGEDEIGCELKENQILSSNNCMTPSLWCDGNFICNINQGTCLKNSVISGTIMGCLFCGLILIIFMMCGLRLYTMHTRNSSYNIHLPTHIATRMRNVGYLLMIAVIATPYFWYLIYYCSLTRYVSLPELIEDDFFHREPPPSYSIAVGQTSQNVESVDMTANRGYRTPWRQIAHTLVNKTPTAPPSSETSNQSSPSRGSITSSSYLSNDENIQLVNSEN